MQKQALIKLFLFLTATSQAAPLNAGNLASRGTKDILDLKIDLSPVSGLPVADPGLTRRQNYGTAPSSTTKTTSTGADEPSYGATEPAAESESDVDGASSSDSDNNEPDYGAESDSDSDSDSDSEAGDDEAETDGADSTQKTTDAPAAAPSYGASPVDTSAGPINPPFALPPVDLDTTADVVTGGSGDEQKSTSTTATEDKPAEEKSTEGETGTTSEPAYGAADSQKSTTAQSTEGETSAPSYGATDAQKTESGADGESAGAPTYA